MSPPLLVAPSLLAADFTRLGEEFRAVDAAGADWIHLDIMDGRFVPDISVRTRRGRGRSPSDRQASQCPSDGGRAGTLARALCPRRRGSSAGPGGARIDHSSPSGAEPRARARLPRGRGDRPGNADPVDRPCPPSRRHHSGDDRQSGFRRPAFLPETLPKIAALRARCADLGLNPHIQADGGQNVDTVRATVSAGADVIVAGTAIFGANDYAEAIAGIRDATCRSEV